MNILITGASGNLGSLTVRHLLSTSHRFTLMIRKSPLPDEFLHNPAISVRYADLNRPETLPGLCSGIDCVLHFAGVLFAPRPETFLSKTNVEYVANLLQAAHQEGVKKFILVSFPHAEGESTPAHPALGTLDATPEVIHFRTRLEAERRVMAAGSEGMTPLIFRAGIVYGKDLKLIRGARWLLRKRVMAIWRDPTWAHLLALPDFLSALHAAVESDSARGIYQVCDDGPLLLQDLLDTLADHWGYSRPMRLPKWIFHATGVVCEFAALVARTPAFVNRDIIRAGMTSCVADTSRMKRELLQHLAYPTIKEGLTLL